MIEHYFSTVLSDRQREVVKLSLEGRVKHPDIPIKEYFVSVEGEPGELFLTPAEVSWQSICFFIDFVSWSKCVLKMI